MLIMIIKGEQLEKDFSNLIKSFNLLPGEPIPMIGEEVKTSTMECPMVVCRVIKDYHQVDDYDQSNDPSVMTSLERGKVVVHVFVK